MHECMYAEHAASASDTRGVYAATMESCCNAHGGQASCPRKPLPLSPSRTAATSGRDGAALHMGQAGLELPVSGWARSAWNAIEYSGDPSWASSTLGRAGLRIYTLEHVQFRLLRTSTAGRVLF